MTRVAAVVEQCWHAVPGGTAISTNAQLAAVLALDDAPDLVGVAARHRQPPPADLVPPVPVRQALLPRRALYAGWLWARRPSVESITGPVDVVHATSAAVPPTTAPLVVTVHDLAFLHFPDHASRNGQRFFERSWQITKREADLVLCPSRATADDCVAHGLSAERTRVVPWGVHAVEPSTEQIAALRRRHGLGDEFVLFVGTVEPRKNLRRLVSALQHLGATAPLLVVAGPAGWDDDIASITAPLGERVRTIGYLPAADLPALHAAATVFAWPSLLEGFGLPVLDAMAQGVPVITSAGTATEEVVGAGGVCVDPRSVDAIADAVGDLIASPQLRSHLGAAGRARAASYTWQRTAELTAAAYRELAR